MTATREHRNAGKVEAQVALIGAAIACADDLWSGLAHALPDDFPSREILNDVRDAYERLQAAIT